jgi:hypothetical protein
VLPGWLVGLVSVFPAVATMAVTNAANDARPGRQSEPGPPRPIFARAYKVSGRNLRLDRDALRGWSSSSEGVASREG